MACLTLILHPSSLILAFAAYEDSGLAARDLAMGGAFTAVADDAAAPAYNPAGLASQRDGALGLGWTKTFQSPAGPGKTETDHGEVLFPLDIPEISGTLGLTGRITELEGFSRDREAAASYAVRGARKGGPSRLDLGATLRVQSRSAVGVSSTRNSLGADAGLLFRRGIHALGLAALNIGAPNQTLAGVEDRAASAFKAGYAQRTPGFIFASDITHRISAAGHPPGYTVAAGVERLWPFGGGAFAGRAGIALGNRARTASAGAGWRVFGCRLDYALLVPMKKLPVGHAATISFSFGGADPVSEYERLLSQEIRHQQELGAVLSRLEAEISTLKTDLEQAHAALEAAKSQSQEKVEQAAGAADALEALRARNAALEERLQRIRGDIAKVDRESLAAAFPRDWAGYQKMKTAGSPAEALKNELERIIHLYKEKGVDLSEVRQELLRLSRD